MQTRLINVRPIQSLRASLLLLAMLASMVTACVSPTVTPVPTIEVPTTATPVPVATETVPPYRDPQQPIEVRVEDLLARMTLAEKIGQMTQIEKGSINPQAVTEYAIGSVLSGGGGSPTRNTPPAWAEMVNRYKAAALNTRLGIPLIYGVDAVHGHGNVRGAVVFPHNIGLGATRNPELVRRIGAVTALEVAATSIDWNFAPVVAVPQDIRWGRTYEAFSEDTALVTELAVAYLKGLQGTSLADPLTVLATPKHFVGDGGTRWGTSTTENYKLDQGVTEVDEATLRAIHLPPYRAAIEAGAQSIMVSFSSWGGMKMHAQHYLITEVLKGELGFQGFVVSDWGGIDQITSDYYRAVVTAINAGIDMNMVPYNYQRFITTLTQAVERGDVPMARIDDAVRRILRVKFALGLFERPMSDPALLQFVGSAEHRALAREAVAQSLVLLKNENAALPIPGDVRLIHVGGVAADDIGIQCGGWTIEWQGKSGPITEGTTILQALEATAGANTDVRFNKFGEFESRAEVGIAVVGELPYAEGRGDRAELTLSEADISVIARLRENSQTLIVILITGRPLILGEALELADAVVVAWLPGTEGQGVADVLFGAVPFTGKLPFRWPVSMEQIPLGASDDPPLFPLGYGLSSADIDR